MQPALTLTWPAGRRRTGLAAARSYLTLTKPGITLLVTITAASGYVAAAGGVLAPLLLLHTVVATALAAAGAAALNQIREAELDARMRRTAGRPLPSGALGRSQAVGLAVALTVTGLTYAAVLLPWTTTLLLAVCHASYVLAYTPLKRRTPLCTLVGTIPGALPVLAGWMATGAPVRPTALALVGILVAWQIPHFLAIGWLCREDYARAGFRILGTVDPTGRASGRVSLVYALALLPTSLVPWLDGGAGPLYAAAALVLGGLYGWRALEFARERSTRSARRLFLASLVYLPALL
ncbi:MAG TPA: heme o synthase, partial [Longimicrobiales bacterium]|nr:heme o synthase [Longimicrobiales bacterium]